MNGAGLSAEQTSAINQRVFETSLELILVTDRRGNIVQVSPSALAILGHRPEEMIGKPASEFLYPDDLEATRTEMRKARHGGVTRHFSCRYRHRDGTVVPLDWMGVWSEPDKFHFFVGRDMSERHRTEAQLRQAQKMEAVGQLTGGLAHDFNNILMVILANIEMIEEEEGLSPVVRELMGEISAAALRASDLTRQLLAFSRKQSLRPEKTDLNALVVSLGRLLQRTLGENIGIQQNLAADLAPTTVDRAQFESALLNLCVNARDAMPAGGQLFIETANAELDEDYAAGNPEAEAGAYAMLSVTDTGTGMSQETAQHVFEPFFTTKAVGKGSGLGLSMVYGFIKQSRGHIKIYSELGRGTSIKIYLPRATAGEDTAPVPAAESMPRGVEHVLLVEDDARVRKGVHGQLASLGYRVTEAESGDGALAMLRDPAFAVDLVLTDMVMPGKASGLMLAQEVRRLRPAVRAVLMSGYTENAVIQEGRLDPDLALLIKPFRKADLARTLRAVLEGQGASILPVGRDPA